MGPYLCGPYLSVGLQKKPHISKSLDSKCHWCFDKAPSFSVKKQWETFPGWNPYTRATVVSSQAWDSRIRWVWLSRQTRKYLWKEKTRGQPPAAHPIPTFNLKDKLGQKYLHEDICSWSSVSQLCLKLETCKFFPNMPFKSCRWVKPEYLPAQAYSQSIPVLQMYFPIPAEFKDTQGSLVPISC